MHSSERNGSRSQLAWASIILAIGTFIAILVVVLGRLGVLITAAKTQGGIGAEAGGGFLSGTFLLVLVLILAGALLGIASLFQRGSSKTLGIVGIGLNILLPVLAVMVLGVVLG